MNCDQVQNQLSGYLDRTLDAGDAAAVEAHLGACSACRAESEALARSIRGVGELAEIEPPANLVRNVMVQVREEAERPPRWRGLFFPLHIKVPVQAVAVLLVSGLAVYIYMTAERSEVEMLKDKTVSTAPRTAVDKKPEEQTAAPGGTPFAQAPPGKGVDTAEGLREEIEVAQDSEFAASPTQGAVGTVSVSKVPPAPERRPKTERETLLREEAPPAPGAMPEGDAASGTLEALIDAGRSRAAKTGPDAAWPEAALRRELELLFAPSQGGSGGASTPESLALLVAELGGRLVAADAAPPGTALARKAAPHVFWVSLPEDRYDRFRTELSARGIITPVSTPVPSATDSESAAESPWVRIKLTVETPR